MRRVGLHAVNGKIQLYSQSLQRSCSRHVIIFSRLNSSSSSPSSTTETSTEYVRKHTSIKGEPIDKEAAQNSPGVQALSARLQLKNMPPSTLARTLIDATSSLKFVNNAGLAKFGKTLLSLYVFEHFMVKYPRLPSQVLKHVVESYTGMVPLAELGHMWGILPDTRDPLNRFLSSSADEQVLGRLSFTDSVQAVEKGVSEVSSQNGGTTDLKNAMGAAVRAIVAGVYAHDGLEAANDFIYKYVVAPRKLDVSRLLAFSRPTRELAVLCAREQLEPPVSRLIAESGRYSNQAVFVVGVFSGRTKLGEGQGTSLREARTRAAVNALQGWYLYSPSPSMAEAAKAENRAVYIDAGEIVV